jgi:uncharacterized protein (TIGR00251 family)
MESRGKTAIAGTHARLGVRVTPRAGRNEIAGWRDAVLVLRVTAAPVEGEANRAVVALLARALRVAPSAIGVERGQRGRDKIVRVEGLTGAEVEARLVDGGLGAGTAGAGTRSGPRP